MRGDGPGDRARAVEEVALALAIPHLLERTVDTLSGGELQRVALAAALVTRPRLVLLDEPTSQLDPVAGDELIWLLRRLNEEWGVAVLLAEHRLERCLAAADRVVAMDAGADRLRRRARATSSPGRGRADPALTTPAARLFSLAGIEPLPVGVRDARRALRSAARPGTGHRCPPPGEGSGRRIAPPSVLALAARRKRRDVCPRGDEPLGRARRRRRAPATSCAASTSTVAPRRAGRADGPQRRRQEHPAARRRRPDRPGRAARSRSPSGIALLTQNPSDYLVRERVGDELPGEAGLAALRAVGLEHAIDADPRDLSGGERQRLALAIALAGRMDGDGCPAWSPSTSRPAAWTAPARTTWSR